MTVVVVNETEGSIVGFGRKAEGVFGEEIAVGDAGGAGGAGDGAEGGVVVMGGNAVLEGVVKDLGNVLVAVVEIVGVFAGGREKDERAGGDGFRGIPNIGLEEDIFGAPELLDTEVVVVGEALEKVGIGRLSAHFDAATHAVESHRDHGVALRPADGAILGVVFHRPLARFREHLGLCSHLAYARGLCLAIHEMKSHRPPFTQYSK